jgi:hypothetical protein
MMPASADNVAACEAAKSSARRQALAELDRQGFDLRVNGLDAVLHRRAFSQRGWFVLLRLEP